MKMQKETLRKKADGIWKICRQLFLVGTLGSLFVFAPLHSEIDASPRIVAKANERMVGLAPISVPPAERKFDAKRYRDHR